MYEMAHTSFRRLRATDFAARFYEVLLASDTRINTMFARTDFARQRDLFMHGVLMLLEYADGKPTGRMALDRIAKMHAHDGLRVPPALYSKWIKSFLETASQCDPEWSDEVHAAWAATLQPGVDHIIRVFEASTPTRLNTRARA